MKTMLTAWVMSVMIFSCRKEVKYTRAEPVVQTKSIVPSITKEVAEVLQQDYEDHGAYMEVNAAIFKGNYFDERIPLKNLLGADTSRFRKKFCEIIEKGNYPLLSGELSDLLKLKRTGSSTIAGKLVLADDSTPSVLSSVNPINRRK